MAYLAQVFKTQMEIAARRQHQPPLESRLQFIAPRLDQFGNERVIRMRMRRRNYVRNPIRNSHFRHFRDISTESGPSSSPGSRWQ